MFLVVFNQFGQWVKATFYPDLRVNLSISRTASRDSPLDRYGWIFSSHLFKTRCVKLQGRCRERTHRCRSRDEDPLLDDEAARTYHQSFQSSDWDREVIISTRVQCKVVCMGFDRSIMLYVYVYDKCMNCMLNMFC